MRTFIDLSPAVYYVRTQDEPGCIQFITDNCIAQLGYAPASFINNPNFWVERIHPTDRPDVIDACAGLAAEGKRIVEYRFLHGDGRYVWVRDVQQISIDQQTKVSEVIGCMLDVTDRKQAEVRCELRNQQLELRNQVQCAELRQTKEALQESSDRYQSIFASAMDAVVVTDCNQRIVLFNPAAERMFACPAREALGDLLDRFIPLRHRAVHTAHVQRFGQTGTTDRRMGTNAAVSGVRSTGEEFPIEAAISRTDVDGRALFTAIVRDVSEQHAAQDRLQRTQQQLRLALGAARMGIWHYDLMLRRTTYSEEMGPLFGQARGWTHDKYEEFLQAVHPDDRECLTTKIKRAIQVADDFQVEFRIQLMDGTERWLTERGQVVRDDQGRCTHLVGVAWDSTDLKQLELSLQESRNQVRGFAQSLDRLREEEQRRIARDLHDELGNLLTASLLDIKSMLQKLPAEQSELRLLMTRLKETTTAVTAAVRHQVRSLRPPLLDTAGLIPAVEYLTRDFASHSHIHCAFCVNNTVLPKNIEFSTTVYRIIQESLTNVGRHANATTVSVDLTEQDQHLVLSIRDNGRGIDRTQSETSACFGLIGMHERALSLGGSLRIDSEPGKGTCVTVDLPYPQTVSS